MTHLTCTSCGGPVLLALNNRILTPAPTPLGIYDPTDGEPLSTADIRARIRKTGAAGHSTHTCPPPKQADLFTSQETT